jgi:hypothetical protein
MQSFSFNIKQMNVFRNCPLFHGHILSFSILACELWFPLLLPSEDVEQEPSKVSFHWRSVGPGLGLHIAISTVILVKSFVKFFENIYVDKSCTNNAAAQSEEHSCKDKVASQRKTFFASKIDHISKPCTSKVHQCLGHQ